MDNYLKKKSADLNKEAKLVLLVDDDPLINRMYQIKLEHDGFRVNVATSGAEGLASVLKEKPDLILLDVLMPEMNGVEALKAIKGDPRMKDIPVVILSNLGDSQTDIQNAKKLGALDYFIKSKISLKELSAQVKKILERQ